MSAGKASLRSLARSIAVRIASLRVPSSHADPAVPSVRGPFPASLYRKLLEDGLQCGVLFTPVPAVVEDRVAVALRHDLDDRPDRLTPFLDIEEELNVHSCSYFIVDGIVASHAYTYNLEDCRSFAERIRARGGGVGLHSIAWAYPDSLSTLARERERFAAIFGMPPSSETFHGFLPRRETASLRRRFNRLYLRRNGAFFEAHRRIVLSDSESRPLCPALRYGDMLRGVPYEILTHPQYWTP
ncbi:MAG TPA: hypothetical protein VI670_19910 [Thermoanaerobaculia bacterium]|jgi:hypothetical protein